MVAAASGEGLSGLVDRTHLALLFQTSSSWIPWIRGMRVQRRASPAAAATCRQRAAPSSSSYRFLSSSEPRRLQKLLEPSPHPPAAGSRSAPLRLPWPTPPTPSQLRAPTSHLLSLVSKDLPLNLNLARRCSSEQGAGLPEGRVPGDLEALQKFGSALDEEGKGAAVVAAGMRDANKRTALHFAAREGRTKVYRFLVEQLRLPVDPKDDDGETSLIHAARQGRLETVEYLLGRGADPSVASNMGATALHHAAGIGHIEIMKILLGKGVDVESESESGTPLVWAAGHGQQDAVKLLLEHNAKPNTETVDGITSLLSAVAAGSLPCLEVLIQICRRENMRWREKKGEEGER